MGPSKVIRSWHGKDWSYVRSFSDGHAEFQKVYIQGTDSIGHVFAPYAPPRQRSIPPDEYERYKDVPERYFAHIDELLGEYRRLAESRGALLFLASDHGFTWHEGRPEKLSSFDATTAAKWHRQEGMYLFWGAGIEARPGHPGNGEVTQTAATLLSVLGLPPAKGARFCAPRRCTADTQCGLGGACKPAGGGFCRPK